MPTAHMGCPIVRLVKSPTAKFARVRPRSDMDVFDMSEQLFFPAKGSCMRTAFPFAEKWCVSGSVSHLSSLELDHCRKVSTSTMLSTCVSVLTSYSEVVAWDLCLCHRPARVGPQQLPAREPWVGGSQRSVLETPLVAGTHPTEEQADWGRSC